MLVFPQKYWLENVSNELKQFVRRKNFNFRVFKESMSTQKPPKK